MGAPGRNGKPGFGRGAHRAGLPGEPGRGTGDGHLSVDWGGFRLTAWDEEGEALSSDRLLVLLTRIQLESGGEAVLPAWAPAAAETVAGSLRGRLLRLGRDGEEALRLWREQPWMWDGIFAACRVCARMGHTGQTLSALSRELPAFATVRAEVPLRSGRGRVIGAVLADGEGAESQGEGVRARVGEGWIYLIPASRRQALRVIAEASGMEAARELCHQYEEKLRSLDERV